MDDSNNIQNRQGLLQQSQSYTVYLPLFSSGIILFYIGVYILRYYCWRIKQRRRKVRLLEYEKLRWAWHQKRLHLRYQCKEEKDKINIDNEQDCANVEKYPYSRSSSSSLSVITINDNKNENETKLKSKQHQHQQQQKQNKCDYGDDSSHCRESSLLLTIPSPAYQPSHDPHSHVIPKPRLPNQNSKQLHHHYHQHQHQKLSSSSASSSSTRKTSSQGHQASYYSSTTTLTCSCIQQHRCKKENNPGTSPILTSSPTTLSFSNPTSPSSSLKETPDLFYSSQEQEEKEITNLKDRSRTHSFDSLYNKAIPSNNTMITPKPSPTQSKSTAKSPYSQQTHWSFYDTKAKRTRMIWKWSVAMGYCHYDHAKMITSIIDQLDTPPRHALC